MIDQPLETRSPAPLRLRTLTPADAGAFARHAAAESEHLREHLGWAESAARVGLLASLASLLGPLFRPPGAPANEN